jgi:superfamily II DNA or RNA helicase
MIHVKETASRLILTGKPAELGTLSDIYRFQPPDYWRSPKFQMYKQTEGHRGWDGYIYPLKVKGMTGILPRGLLSDLKDKAMQVDLVLDLSGTLHRPFENMVLDDVPSDLVSSDHPDYDHQRDIVWKWVRNCMGIGEITVSGGKTRSFCMAAALLKRKIKKLRVLYLVPTERLVKQAYKDSKGFLPDWNITQFGGSARDNTGDMVVATYAIIGRNYPSLVNWLNTFNVLFVDEAHHASSPTLSKIITTVPAYFKFGATDSAKENDPIKGKEIEGLLGPVLATVAPGELIESGALAKPMIYIVDVQSWHNRFEDLTHQAELNTPAWAYVGDQWKKAIYLGPACERDELGNPIVDRKGNQVQLTSVHRLDIDGMELDVESRWCLLDRAYDRAIVRYRDRNQLGLDWAEHFHKTGERTLMVATRTLHVMVLQAELEKRIGADHVRILFSEHNTKERDATFEWLKETPGSVLISPLVKEGVSIPELTAGVIMDYVGTIDLARQLVGRFIRKKRHREENSAKIVWFVDRQVPSYRRGSLELISQLEKIKGYSFTHPVQGPDTIDLGLTYEGR